MKNFLTLENRGDYSPLCQNYLRLTCNKFGAERHLAKLFPIPVTKVVSKHPEKLLSRDSL